MLQWEAVAGGLDRLDIPDVCHSPILNVVNLKNGFSVANCTGFDKAYRTYHQ